ncbi:hypothetical protein FRB95_004100 [Tulasnella sp. JGI-2019a]|nr:hypothetical protein FRB93_002478 [Tulasnella sp. JGI-2019a]KAG9037813.1 hypothetical protein FRB95_004100 [Tulasnella sp. JGI-2019a]
MADDPYHEVKAEVQTSLQTASTLRASYLRIASTATGDSEELRWAGSELKATLAALDADLEDLEESVRIVEGSGGRSFGIDDNEVVQRRQFCRFVRAEIESMRADLSPEKASSSRQPPRPVETPSPGEEDDQSEWERQEQAILMRQQDSTLSTIAGTLGTLVEQAGLMGREIGEHNEMLSDLEANVDRTSNKLGGAMKTMQKFIRDTEETKSGWCIGILIVVLLCLLIAVVLV